MVGGIRAPLVPCSTVETYALPTGPRFPWAQRALQSQTYAQPAQQTSAQPYAQNNRPYAACDLLSTLAEPCCSPVPSTTLLFLLFKFFFFKKALSRVGSGDGRMPHSDNKPCTQRIQHLYAPLFYTYPYPSICDIHLSIPLS